MTETTAPEGYGRIEWPEVRAGDVLLRENGDRLTVTETTRSSGVGSDELGYHDGIEIAGQLRFNAEELIDSGFTPYRKQPELPTVPGAYMDKGGDLWQLIDSGTRPWWMVGDEGQFTPAEAADYAPFTRWVPMPTEDAVHAAVYNALRGSAVEGVYPLRTINAVMALLGGGDDE